MAKIILDSNEIEVDNVYERITDNVLTSLKTIKLDEGEVPEIPEITDTHFTTLAVKTNAGVTIPIVCEYNKIESFTTQYIEEDNIFSYNLNLGKE